MPEKPRGKGMISGLCRRENPCEVLRANKQTDPFWSQMPCTQIQGKRRNICGLLMTVNPQGQCFCRQLSSDPHNKTEDEVLIFGEARLYTVIEHRRWGWITWVLSVTRFVDLGKDSISVRLSFSSMKWGQKSYLTHRTVVGSKYHSVLLTAFSSGPSSPSF